jgi:hypothetical protein
LSVTEAALTEIAIFDERASGVFLKDGTLKVFSSPRLLEATLAGLHPLIAVHAFDAPGGAFAIDNVDWEAMAKTFGTAKPQSPTSEFLYPYPQRGDLKMKAVYAADILVLHEGLVEELVSKNRFRQGSELCYLSRFAQIVRTSGKGRDPRKLDTRLPFCEYSAISAVLAPYRSNDGEHIRFDKIILAKAVMNSFGQPSQKENPS